MPRRPASYRPSWMPAPAERNRRFDKQRGTSSRRGYDGQWRRVRAAAIALQPCCVWCGSTDRLNVDHIQSIREAPHLRLELGNLRVLCQSCHSRRTRHDQAQGWGRS